MVYWCLLVSWDGRDCRTSRGSCLSTPAAVATASASTSPPTTSSSTLSIAPAAPLPSSFVLHLQLVKPVAHRNGSENDRGEC